MGIFLFFVLFFEKNRIFLDFIVWRMRLLKHKDFSCSLCLDLGRFWGVYPLKFTVKGCVFGDLKAHKEGVEQEKSTFLAVLIKLGLFCKLLIYY